MQQLQLSILLRWQLLRLSAQQILSLLAFSQKERKQQGLKVMSWSSVLLAAVLYYGHSTLLNTELSMPSTRISACFPQCRVFCTSGIPALPLYPHDVWISLPSGYKAEQLHPFVHNGRNNLPHTLEIIPQFSYDYDLITMNLQQNWPPAVQGTAEVQTFCHDEVAVGVWQDWRAPTNLPPSWLTANPSSGCASSAAPAPALAHKQSLSALSPSSSTYLCAPTDCTSVISTVFTNDTAFGPP